MIHFPSRLRKVTINQIPDITSDIIIKLKKLSINSVYQLAVQNPIELASEYEDTSINVESASVQKFIEYKKSRLIPKMYDTVRRAVKGLGNDIKIQRVGETHRANDINHIQRQIFDETRQKLYGRNVHARGSIMFVHDELWYFPNQLHIT